MSADVSVPVSLRFRQGAGRLCLGYLRTLRYRGRPEVTEELADPEALAAWVGQCGPCGGRVPIPTIGQLQQARAVREGAGTWQMVVVDGV